MLCEWGTGNSLGIVGERGFACVLIIPGRCNHRVPRCGTVVDSLTLVFDRECTVSRRFYHYDLLSFPLILTSVSFPRLCSQYFHFSPWNGDFGLAGLQYDEVGSTDKIGHLEVLGCPVDFVECDKCLLH